MRYATRDGPSQLYHAPPRTTRFGTFLIVAVAGNVVGLVAGSVAGGTLERQPPTTNPNKDDAMRSESGLPIHRRRCICEIDFPTSCGRLARPRPTLRTRRRRRVTFGRRKSMAASQSAPPTGPARGPVRSLHARVANCRHDIRYRRAGVDRIPRWVFRPHVVAPLPRVADHVVQPPGVRLERADRRCVSITIGPVECSKRPTLVCSHECTG